MVKIRWPGQGGRGGEFTGICFEILGRYAEKQMRDVPEAFPCIPSCFVCLSVCTVRLTLQVWSILYFSVPE